MHRECCVQERLYFHKVKNHFIVIPVNIRYCTFSFRIRFGQHAYFVFIDPIKVKKSNVPEERVTYESASQEVHGTLGNSLFGNILANYSVMLIGKLSEIWPNWCYTDILQMTNRCKGLGIGHLQDNDGR